MLAPGGEFYLFLIEDVQIELTKSWFEERHYGFEVLDTQQAENEKQFVVKATKSVQNN